MSPLSKRVLLGLFQRLGLLLILVGGLGGLVAVNGELSRAGITLPLRQTFELFLLGLPEVLFSLLPLCAVLSIVGMGASLRSTQSWMALRLSGQGGRALLLPVGFFAWGVVALMALLGAQWSQNAEATQQKILLKHAEVIPHQPVQLGDVELLAGGGTLQSLHDVVIALADPPLHAASGQASLDREKGVLYLSDGLLIHDSEQVLSLHFEQLELKLDGRQEPVGSGAPKDLLESRKKWTWSLMAGLLCLVVVPASLRGRAGLALGFWLSVWGVVRFCDHYMGTLGLSVALLIPPLFLLSALVMEWLRWEEA